MKKTNEAAEPKPQRGRPRDPERTQRILQAAGSHFSMHGLERASVDAIAAQAGVSKMTVYKNFGSKVGLFEAVVQDRAQEVMGGIAGAQALDPAQPRKALLAIGTRFLMLTREEDVLGKFRAVYGAAGAQPDACEAFFRQGPQRLNDELAAYLRQAQAAGTLKVPHPREAANLFLSMFLGEGHMRGLLMLGKPEPAEHNRLPREAVRVFMAAYGT